METNFHVPMNCSRSALVGDPADLLSLCNIRSPSKSL
jgi:hypothetical protein